MSAIFERENAQGKGWEVDERPLKLLSAGTPTDVGAKRVITIFIWAGIRLMRRSFITRAAPSSAFAAKPSCWG